MNGVCRYTVMENIIGAEDKSVYKTCKEAMDACFNEREAVYREGYLIDKPAIIECYEYDIRDLKEALKGAVKNPENLRWQVRAFVTAYSDACTQTEALRLPSGTMNRLRVMAERFGKTEEEIISALIRPYFMNLQD